MNKYTGLAATTQTLSVAAVEEASRFSQRTADLEHLFLALVLSDGDAGRVLRGMGITLERTRKAVVTLHSLQLATLGIDAEIPQSPISVPQGSEGYELSPRVLKLFNGIAPSAGVDYSALVLKSVLSEPSGLIDELLNLLGTNSGEVGERLDEFAVVEKNEPEPETDSLVASTTSFVPGGVDDVWELLTDPSRMTEWGPSFGRVEWLGGADEATPGDTWNGYLPEVGPDGKLLRIKPGAKRQVVELLERCDRERISWRFSYPDMPDSNTRRISIVLNRAPGGTELNIETAWERNLFVSQRTRIGRVLLAPARPLMRLFHRWIVWTQVTQIGSSIGRVFR
ncbi:MAG: Clp protease N-terminal domain-containing protein [Ancrocorticia sp.]